jgi:amidase
MAQGQARDELVFRSAGEIADAIRNRRVSAVEVVEAHLRRIERCNPALNAVVTLDAEGALDAARGADAALARGEFGGLLHGVPVTLKDCHETAGMRTTAGFPPLAENVPPRDGTVARRLRQAGAILLGKTNVSQLLADVQSDNPIFGRTNNPWNVERTPGGSSGGAAAAVAAGMAALEVGSDIGGSIRIPAHCCGIYGLKPTEGLCSTVGHVPGQFGVSNATRVMNVVGPMARSLDDLELGLRLLAGPDDEDMSVPSLPLPEVVAPPLGGLRVAWAGSFPGTPVAGSIRMSIERVATALDAHGAAVEETLPELDFTAQLATRARLRAYVSAFGGYENPPADPSLTPADFFATMNARDDYQHAWDRFFVDWDVLLCPVMMVTAFPHVPRDTPLLVDGVEHEYIQSADYCRPFNLTGHPGVVIPVGHDDDGLPIGVQLVGPRWSDVRLLGIARAIDAVVGTYARPPECPED